MAPVGYTSVDSSIADDVSLSMDDRPSSSSLRLSTIDRPSSTTSTITSAIASEYWFIYQFEWCYCSVPTINEPPSAESAQKDIISHIQCLLTPPASTRRRHHHLNQLPTTKYTASGEISSAYWMPANGMSDSSSCVGGIYSRCASRCNQHTWAAGLFTFASSWVLCARICSSTSYPTHRRLLSHSPLPTTNGVLFVE